MSSTSIGYKPPLLVRNRLLVGHVSNYGHAIIAHPHLLVRGTNERFLPTGGTFGVGITSESHWLQPVLVLTVHW
jgi:hypothetical protein